MPGHNVGLKYIKIPEIKHLRHEANVIPSILSELPHFSTTIAVKDVVTCSTQVYRGEALDISKYLVGARYTVHRSGEITKGSLYRIIIIAIDDPNYGSRTKCYLRRGNCSFKFLLVMPFHLSDASNCMSKLQLCIFNLCISQKQCYISYLIQ